MRRAAVLALLVLAGCGGSSGDEPAPSRGPAPQLDPPQAAEPARSPAPAEDPEGEILRPGGPAEGLVIAGDGTIAAARQDRPELVLLRGGRVTARVPLPAAPRHLDLQSPAGPVLVPAEEANALVRVGLDGETTRTKAGDHPHDATSAAGTTFTADEFGSTVTRASDGRSTPVDAQPGGITTVGDRLAVISVRAYTVELLDPRTLRGGGSQNAGLGPTHVVGDRAGRLYITDTRGDALVTFATRPRLKFLSRTRLPGSPYGIAVAPEGDRLWVTTTQTNEVHELRTGDEPALTATVPTVRQPNTVAAGPGGRVCVASATDDAIGCLDR